MIKEFLKTRLIECSDNTPIEELMKNDPEYQKAEKQFDDFMEEIKGNSDPKISDRAFEATMDMVKVYMNTAYIQGLKDGFELRSILQPQV